MAVTQHASNAEDEPVGEGQSSPGDRREFSTNNLLEPEPKSLAARVVTSMVGDSPLAQMLARTLTVEHQRPFPTVMAQRTAAEEVLSQVLDQTSAQTSLAHIRQLTNMTREIDFDPLMDNVRLVPGVRTPSLLAAFDAAAATIDIDEIAALAQPVSDELQQAGRQFADSVGADLSPDTKKRLTAGFIGAVVLLLLLQASIVSDAVEAILNDGKTAFEYAAGAYAATLWALNKRDHDGNDGDGHSGG